MKQIQFDTLEETLWEGQLPNGLRLMIVPKPDYHSVYAMLTVAFGGLHTAIRINPSCSVPIASGAAHFLEHKLFEGPNGEDISMQLLKNGATANAFTTLFQTSYTLSCTMEVEKNIQSLLDFVQRPYFSQEGVEKEKSIITQEWSMYQDDPYAKLYQTTLAQLYPQHAVAQDILGTYESIQQMDAQQLCQWHQFGYLPENMCLVIVGNIEVERLVAFLVDTQTQSSQEAYHFPLEIPAVPVISEGTIYHDISQPLVALGLRLPLPQGNKHALLDRLQVDILVEMLVGPTSANYQYWYDQQWIDEHYYITTVSHETLHFIYLEGHTDAAESLLDAWQNVWAHWHTQSDWNESQFHQIIRGKKGDFIRSLNDLETIATDVTEGVLHGYCHFELLQCLEQLTFADMQTFAQHYLTDVQSTIVKMFPLQVE
ncbi:MAG: pitrilysin family protein [Aerococcaceae bacterium]|nr:pitrilysin family protein [Aerococcaceae bacterium]